MKKAKSIILILIISIPVFILGGNYGYYLAEKNTTTKWISGNTIQAIINLSMVSEGIDRIDRHDFEAARDELENLSIFYQGDLKRCIETDYCRDRVKESAENALKNL